MKMNNSRLTIDGAQDFGSFGESVQRVMETIEDRLDEVSNILSATEDSDDIAVSDVAYTGAITGTTTSANAIAVGPAGATNPTFKVVCSTSSAATGLSITSAAAAGGLALAVISSGDNENLTINSKGTGTVTINSVGTGNVIVGSALAFGTDASAAKQIIAGTTNGLLIGTGVTQKIGLWNKTPVVQPAAAGQAAVTTSVTTTATTTNLKTTVAAIIVLLNQIRTDLVSFGAIKGSA